MWHKPCRTFNPWCLCIKTRCLWCNVSTKVDSPGLIPTNFRQCPVPSHSTKMGHTPGSHTHKTHARARACKPGNWVTTTGDNHHRLLGAGQVRACNSLLCQMTDSKQLGKWDTASRQRLTLAANSNTWQHQAVLWLAKETTGMSWPCRGVTN